MESKKAVTLMPRDVATRWNSTFNLLSYALDHRKAVDTVTQRRDLGLRKFELGEEEWELLDQLCAVLKVSSNHISTSGVDRTYVTCDTQILKDATLFFSRATPNLATTIPAMDHIDQVLTSNSLDNHFTLAIRAALGTAKKTLNHYYQLTDDSEVYRIAMGE